MKKISIIFFLFVIVLNTSISAETWSPYMGRMDWDSASAKCKSIGMRLPTIDELKAAYNSGITKSWQKDGILCWSSTPYGAEGYYSLDVNVGFTSGYHRNYSYFVRCRR
jgi:hypothetical protein